MQRKYFMTNEKGQLVQAQEQEIVSILQNGGVGILPTDTLYGIVGSALNSKTVERIYALRHRDLAKPMIVLVSSIKELAQFVSLNTKQQKILSKLWPAKLSIVLPCDLKEFAHLHRGSNAIAFRFPADEQLRTILEKTGPLVAPSANLAGKEPANSIEQAQNYFGKDVEFYVDAGNLNSEPSTLIQITAEGTITVLRQGAVKLGNL